MSIGFKCLKGYNVVVTTKNHTNRMITIITMKHMNNMITMIVKRYKERFPNIKDHKLRRLMYKDGINISRTAIYKRLKQ